MTSVWLPFDDWAQHLRPPAGCSVAVWRDGLPLPADPATVDFYVPEYMGPVSVLEVLDQMPGLRVLQTLTAGYDHVLGRLPKGAVLCNARGVHEASTAELAVGLTIAALRGLPGFVRAQDQGVWLHARHDALADKRVAVIGPGAVGSAVMARLAPFEVDVISVGRTARPGVASIDDISGVLPGVDVVILAVPFDSATRGMVDASFLRQLPDGALLVNVSRGAVVDTDALVAELESGRLRAAVDVTDPEPLPASHPLWHAPNALVTPHVGGDTSAFLPRAWRLLRDQISRYADDRPLANVIAPSPPTRTES